LKIQKGLLGLFEAGLFALEGETMRWLVSETMSEARNRCVR
jgi:hypothetical protein